MDSGDQVDLDDQDRKLWNQFKAMPGNEFEFAIGRSREVIARDGLTKGLSEAAMHTLYQHLMLYVGTRIARLHEQTAQIAQQCTVRIRVSLDAEPATFDETLETVRLPDRVVSDDRITHERKDRGNDP